MPFGGRRQAAVPGSPDAARCESLEEKAVETMVQGGYSRATELFTRVVEARQSLALTSPDDRENLASLTGAYLELATLARVRQRPGESMALSQEVVAIAERHHLLDEGSLHRDAGERVAEALRNMGELYTERQEYDQARGHFERALELWRKLADGKEVADSTHTSLAMAYVDLCDNAQKLGQQERARGFCEKGASILEKVVATNPDALETQHMLTYCYFFLGAMDLQYPILEHLFEQEPDNEAYGADLLETVVLFGKYERAVELAPDVVALYDDANADRIVLLAYWAIAEAMLGHREEAAARARHGAREAELLTGKPGWAFSGALLVLEGLEHPLKDEVVRLVKGLESWTLNSEPSSAVKALESFAALVSP